ncbi:MAG: SMC-Scp complex subunit ScpB [Phycisphaeraceae bacterium]|nr:SMC-Scp complex subunit ScpB [Phycisphaeraceae bacterium]
MPEGVDLTGGVEALLVTSDRPIASRRIAQALGLIAGEEPAGRSDRAAIAEVEGAVAALNDAYARSGRSFRIESVAGGYRMMTLPAYAPVLASMQALRAPTKLSRAALETLAIVAYRQPIGRAQLESIRGVACGEVLKTLMERRLVTIVGRAEELGRPMLYGTTRQFLDAFGLASLHDLPNEHELSASP